MMKALWSRDEVILNEYELSVKRKANSDYMMSLSRDNLMRNHMFEAGRCSASYLQDGIHGGWESPTSQVRGHFTGHWLSAAALHDYSTGDGEMIARAYAMVNELAECQKDNGGEWAASIPEKYLHWIAAGKGVWAPQYTIHKTFLGLLDMAQYARCEQALKVAESFAKWFLRWIEKFTREEFDDILDVETGGMLEIWVQLLELTGNGVYQKLIDKYYRSRLFDVLLDGGDPLTNMHANTTIPEIIGCARAYGVTGEKKWREIVEAYWRCAVTERGAFATGGQTCGEIWTPKKQLDKRLGEKNQEYCTVYNMMRLADYLFMWTGDAKYADYYEQNMQNGILAQSYWRGIYSHGAGADTPDSGLLTYFLPLMPGGKKGWATETQDFFCCHGTLVQSNAQLNRGIYYQDDGSLYVCQYYDSEVRAAAGGRSANIIQKRDDHSGSFHLESASHGRHTISNVTTEFTAHPDRKTVYFQITTEKNIDMQIRFRRPYWTKGNPEMYINGKRADCGADKNGFIQAGNNWNNGDIIKLDFPMGISVSTIPGNGRLAAFHYGPLTLAGICDGSRALNLPEKPEELLVHDNEREWGNWKSSFRTIGQDKNIRFIPIKDVGYERYSVYFDIDGK
jgi:DUF1680 family protein